MIFLQVLFWSSLLFGGNSLPLPWSRFDAVSYDVQLSHNEENCSSSDCRVAAQYLRGKLWTVQNPERACQAFSQIADKSSILYPILLVKKEQTCKPDAALIDQITKYIQDKKPRRWLESTLLDAAVDMALKTSSDQLATLALQSAKSSRFKTFRIKGLQKVLSQGTWLSEKQSREIRDELYRLSPKLQPVPQDWWAVGVDALSSHDEELAITAFQKVVKNRRYTQDTHRQALENLRASYKAAQRKTEALNTAKRLFEWDMNAVKKTTKSKKKRSEAAKRLLSSTVSLSRAQWTEQNQKGALEILSKGEKVLGKRVPLGDLYFVRGRIYEEQGHTDKALKWMDLGVKNTPDPSIRSSYQWALAWLNFKLKNYRQTIEILKAQYPVEPEPGRKAQQMFWLAKSYDLSGHKDSAKEILSMIVAEDPLGYYSLLSTREMGLPLSKPLDSDQTPFTKIPKKLTAAHFEDQELLDWLSSLGEYSYARQLLDEELPLPDTSTEEWQDVFVKYAKANDYAPIFAKINKLTPAEKQQLLTVHPHLLFPEPFKDLIDEASTRSGLWPEYIFSIMRQESSFDPLSISGVSAYGLLQLLPSVAKPLARRMSLPYQKPEDLLDPATNITLGAVHLRKYWDLFDGQFILATAAYNASPDTVKAWVKTRYHGDILTFIEDIPYEETRTYVKLVLRNFINYLRLNSSGSSIPFPEWCLQGIQASKD